MLTFALPLYILQTQESPALFGTVLGLSFLPLIIASPIGGIMADRLKKQRIMFWLDVTITIMIVLFMIVSGMFSVAIVPIVIIKLLMLNIIQGMYMPCVQGGTPLLVPADKLVRANSATSAVNTLSNVAAPAVAAFLLGMFGLFSILLVSAICFAITAVMDLLIRFPYEKQQSGGNIIQIVKNDTAQAYHFVKKHPILMKIAAIMCVSAMIAGGVLMVGIPVFALQDLGLSLEHVGIGRGISWTGALVGTAITSTLGERLTIKSVPLTSVLLALALIPVGIALIFDMHHLVAFGIMVASDFAFSIIMLPWMIPMWAYVQKITPPDLVGKVMSLFSAIPFFAFGIGYLVFGLLFERFYNVSWLIVFVSSAIILVVALLVGKYFKRV
ncbi:MAG: MFS transporter [Defluviitaleaceae bacterium]|nr:MFS transporter [Defluviitaleaceae bacterium]